MDFLAGNEKVGTGSPREDVMWMHVVTESCKVQDSQRASRSHLESEQERERE